MILSRLYCNDTRFKEVNFNKGFNFIIGKIKNQYGKNDTHNLGKTKLADLIDFMLLLEGSNVLRKDQKIFLIEYKESFVEHIFYLEILLNTGNYLTIKRGVEASSKVSFKIHQESKDHFIKCREWDYLDVSLSSKKNKNAKEVLREILNFDILKEYTIRNYLGYFLRTQYDYEKTFELKNRTDIQWKPMLLEILGFEKSDLLKKYEFKKDLDLEKKILKRENEKENKNLEDVVKLTELIQTKAKEKEAIENKLDQFDFFLEEEEINKEIITRLEEEISLLNSKRYYLGHELNRIKKKLELKEKFKFDLEKTENIFNEVNLNFPSDLKRNYKELIEFNEKITIDRRQTLKGLLNDKQKSLEKISKELEILNEKRVKGLDYLTKLDTFKKFKEYQKYLIVKEEEILNLNNKLNQINNVENVEKKIRDLNADIKDVDIQVKKIALESSNSNFFKEIQSTYKKLLEAIINQEAILNIRTNRNNNIEFDKKVLNEEKEVTGKGDGYTYGRILTACFDLALLIVYSKISFVKFIYHDGIFEGLDPREKNRLYEKIKEICKEKKVQYIVTALETDLTQEIVKDKRYIEDDVVLTLTDEADGKGTLLGFEF